MTWFNNSTSAAHSAHSAMCARTSAIPAASSFPCTKSGKASRISALSHLFIQQLLHRANRVVIVHPRRTLCSSENRRDFLVSQPLLHTHREHVALHRRERFHRPPNSP